MKFTRDVPLLGEGQPEAVIEQLSRWTYRVYVKRGVMIWGPGGYGWTVWGMKRADRKARKVLRKYIQDREFESNRIVIHIKPTSRGDT